MNKEEMLEKLKDWENIHMKLRRELEDASHQLIVNSSDLANSKVELQRHRSEIDVSFLKLLFLIVFFFNEWKDV